MTDPGRRKAEDTKRDALERAAPKHAVTERPAGAHPAGESSNPGRAEGADQALKQSGEGQQPEPDDTAGHAGSTLDLEAVTELRDAWRTAERSRPTLPQEDAEDADGLGPTDHEIRKRTENR